jgi:hypothetical protein
MYNFTKIMKQIITSQTPDTDKSTERLSVLPNDEVEYNLATTTSNLTEAISKLNGTPTANKPEILLTLTKLKQFYDIETPHNIIQELQPTGLPLPHNLSEDTITWIQELRNEMIVTLTQIKDAPKLANTMRRKTEPTPELTADFQAILSKIQTTDELRAALRRCQAGKCGGPSGITREHLLYLPDDVLEHFIAPINSIIDGTCTDKYKLGAIVPLLKDERRYRPVTLLETLWKTAMTRISDRLLDVLHKHKLLHPTLYAFIRGGSTHAPLDIMAHVMQRSKAMKTETHMLPRCNQRIRLRPSMEPRYSIPTPGSPRRLHIVDPKNNRWTCANSGNMCRHDERQLPPRRTRTRMPFQPSAMGHFS